MKITNRRLDTIRPYENNPRVITPDAVDAVARSIEQFGWLRGRPIVVDADGVIIIGHTRRLAALQLGRKTVPVVVAEHLSADDANACRLVDNRTGEQTAWDYDALAAELRDMGDDADLLLGLWDADELTALRAQIADAAADALNDPAPAGRAEPAGARAAGGAARTARPPTAPVCPNCGRPADAA